MNSSRFFIYFYFTLLLVLLWLQLLLEFPLEFLGRLLLVPLPQLVLQSFVQPLPFPLLQLPLWLSLSSTTLVSLVGTEYLIGNGSRVRARYQLVERLFCATLRIFSSQL